MKNIKSRVSDDRYDNIKKGDSSYSIFHWNILTEIGNFRWQWYLGQFWCYWQCVWSEIDNIGDSSASSDIIDKSDSNTDEDFVAHCDFCWAELQSFLCKLS